VAEVSCPWCGAIIPFTADEAGTSGRCPGCHQGILFPDTSFAPTPAPRSRSTSEACRVCGSTAPLRRVSETSIGGWIVFAVMLLTCIPASPFALFIKDRWAVCSRCGCRVHKVGSETWPLYVLGVAYFGALLIGAVVLIAYLNLGAQAIRTYVPR